MHGSSEPIWSAWYLYNPHSPIFSIGRTRKVQVPYIQIYFQVTASICQNFINWYFVKLFWHLHNYLLFAWCSTAIMLYLSRRFHLFEKYFSTDTCTLTHFRFVWDFVFALSNLCQVYELLSFLDFLDIFMKLIKHIRKADFFFFYF